MCGGLGVLFDCASWFFLDGCRRINEVKMEGQMNLSRAVIINAQRSVTFQPEAPLLHCDVYLLVSERANTDISSSSCCLQTYHSTWASDSHHAVCLCVLE